MKNKACDKTMTFQECELAILRLAVDKAEEKIGRRIVSSDEIKKMIVILENFLKRKNLICYGGTAINNYLPKNKDGSQAWERVWGTYFYKYNVSVKFIDSVRPHMIDNNIFKKISQQRA